MLNNMTLKDIARLRMYNQGIEGKKFKKPEDVVRHMGAMQAQDYNAVLKAVAVRMEKPDIAAVEKAINDGRLVRSWPMRRTVHLMTREDARWMLDLMVVLALKPMIPRGEKVLGITEPIIRKAAAIVTKALKGGKALPRSVLYELLDKNGIKTRVQPGDLSDRWAVGTIIGMHILVRLAHEQLICFGPRQGKESTFVLLDEWIPRKQKFTRDEALRELVIRYYTSHGPAQIKDLGWWSGLTQKDIKKGIELAGKKLTSIEVEGKTYYMAPNPPKVKDSSTAHLLPAFDEFMIAYKDRDASLESAHAHHINPGANGVLAPIIVINGQIIGTWRQKGKEITTHRFAKLSPAEKKAIDQAIERLNAR
jgi:hypothetical protein